MGENPDVTIVDNDIPDITMSFKRTEGKIFPDITILQYQYTVIEFSSRCLFILIVIN